MVAPAPFTQLAGKCMITIDFETEAIEGNPITKPPRPVGVAVNVNGTATYLAFGHPTENTHEESIVKEYIARLLNSGEDLLFHNASFDLSVARDWLGSLPKLYPTKVHDTMYLLFLRDPYAATLSLKPSAEKYLNLPPTEQDEVKEWVLKNVRYRAASEWGAHIGKAPGGLVGRYAIGDVDRTAQLFENLSAYCKDKGMWGAYQREQELFPILYAGTLRGIRVDRERLWRDMSIYEDALVEVTTRVTQKLGVDPDMASGNELADALERGGFVTDWVLTKTGKRSMSQDNLKISDRPLSNLLNYRAALKTCLQTFMRPWYDKSSDGRLHPNWNQVRQPRGDSHSKGTRTGRLSSDDPNFQNVPTEFMLDTPTGLPKLPSLRVYCLPEEGHVWLKRDFSSQEIRMMAHFEDGALAEAFTQNPDLDPHQMAVDMIKDMTGVTYSRKIIKITGFSIIYGTGVSGLATQLGVDHNTASEIKSAYLMAMPGLKALSAGIMNRGRATLPIVTWGGRQYYAEPPSFSKTYNRMMSYEYKLLNYLIQGSSADQTKQALIDWNRDTSDVFLATVHDEINISAPAEHAKEAMELLAKHMNAPRFDVPMLSEGFIGSNWQEIEKL